MAGEVRKTRQTVPILCKLVELCLTIVIVGLIVDPTNNGILQFDQNHSGIVYVAWPGYIIINTVLLLGYIIGDRIPKRTSMIFSLVAACIFIASSGVSLADWVKSMYHTGTITPSKQYSDQTIAAGILSLFAAVVFLLDIVLTARMA